MEPLSPIAQGRLKNHGLEHMSVIHTLYARKNPVQGMYIVIGFCFFYAEALEEGSRI
jgi:hypothetical protein